MTTQITTGRHRGARPWGHGLRLVGLSLGLCLAAAVSACDSDTADDDPAETRMPSQSETRVTASANDGDAALTAYRGMWRAYAIAGLTANPQEPELARYATGDALSALTSGLTKLRADGEVIKGDYTSAPQVVSASPSAAPASIAVQDCLDTTRFLTYKAATGALVDDTPGGNRAVRATVIRDGTVWKVSSFGAQAVGTC
ncbi:hypothetical protein AB0H28_27230 [Micromonospora sp. NPDC050980]|uniref:hypothetical protein n=1 Tax=Micromonospora sp. NPDC050980 TaxID=3155161 RepID=UPI0033E78298